MSDDKPPPPRRPGVEGWDRIGEFMERFNDTGQAMSRRHLDVWNKVSSSLRAEKFTADDWARNSALVISSMIDDVRGFSRLWERQERRPAAEAVPVVLLRFDLDDRDRGPMNVLPDPPPIPAPRLDDPLPKTAVVSLSGVQTKTAVDRVRDAIKVKLDPDGKPIYHVECSGLDAEDSEWLSGVYIGLIYIRSGQADIPLADLRVIVQSRDED